MNDTLLTIKEKKELIQKLLRKVGSINKAICAIAAPKNCARMGARQCAEEYSEYLGITPAEFMKRWIAMR